MLVRGSAYSSITHSSLIPHTGEKSLPSFSVSSSRNTHIYLKLFLAGSISSLGGIVFEIIKASLWWEGFQDI